MARILVVEDDYDVGLLLQLMLEQEHEVRRAGDGLQALESIGDHRPDIVILDVMLPALDGFRMLNRLRSNPEQRDVKVILLTALSEAVDMVLGLELGADFYLTKPFEPEDLLALVQKLDPRPGLRDLDVARPAATAYP
jgi:two-component system, OmpR family, alkaline phosphatase synthesis response regulator PhoP